MNEGDSMNNNNVKTDPVALVKTYVPFLSFLALAYGIVNQWVYYYAFNINILEYTDLNELLLSALTSFVLLTLYITVVGLYYWFSIIKVIKRPQKRNRPMIFVLFMTYGFTVIPAVYYCFFDGLWNNYSEFSLVTFTVITVLLMILAKRFEQWYAAIFNTGPNNAILKLVVALIMTINFSICAGIFQIGKIKNRPETGIAIVIGNKVISSTKSYFQIGRTSNYTFFYNVKDGQTDIFPNKDISRISIK